MDSPDQGVALEILKQKSPQVSSKSHMSSPLLVQPCGKHATETQLAHRKAVFSFRTNQPEQISTSY
jgi:hypothetical protein